MTKTQKISALILAALAGPLGAGQAIWVSGPARPKGPWRIWRWPGGAPGAPGTPGAPGAPGAPVQITALPPLGASPYYGVGAIAW